METNIIQIAAMPGSPGIESQLYALCQDGSVWRRYVNRLPSLDPGWQRLDPKPPEQERPPARNRWADVTNKDRAEWARAAVNAFKEITRSDDDDAVADLLCDLMHLCGEDGPSEFEAQLARAKNYYDAEIKEDKE